MGISPWNLLYGVVCVSSLEGISIYISLDMKNIAKTTNKKLSEDCKEMIRILLAFVIMGIIFWFMLVSSSAPGDNSWDRIFY